MQKREQVDREALAQAEGAAQQRDSGHETGTKAATGKGAVWLARQRRLDRNVVVKLLHSGREETTGGYHDSTARSALVSALAPAPLVSWAPAALEVGASEDRTRYTSDLQREVLGAERRDRTGAQWVRLRQPLKNTRTSVEVRYDHSQTRSTIAGLDVGGHQGAVGLYHVF